MKAVESMKLEGEVVGVVLSISSSVVVASQPSAVCICDGHYRLCTPLCVRWRRA